MRTAAVQLDILWEDRNANFRKVERFAAQAANLGADFLVLPEMFATGFSMNTAATAEAMEGPTPSFLREIALRHHLGVLGGFVLKPKEGKARNCALAVDRNGNDLALYTKTFLFSYMGEERCHQEGDGPVFFEFEGCKMTCFICYDLRFPELFRKAAFKTDVAFVIASWPAKRARHWETLLPARAVENQFYVVGVNRTGAGDGLLFSGGSMMIDPLGMIEGALEGEESLLIGNVLPEKVQQTRRELPFLRDIRDL